jgi:ubiquinone/menaquinone biosynthesis C-methylase UbiE
MKEETIKKVVREGYGKVARESSSCCLPVVSCCGAPNSAEAISREMGYTEEDLRTVPQGANLGLGCGNPVALASLKQGETVLDLGAGAGFDCFLAAHQVGKDGRVIGVDMTPEMVDKARENARKASYENVEFRLGEIENLPVADNHVDVVISNCVINLAPDKGRVFQEAFRVLKPGGRLMVSDIVVTKDLPDVIKNSIQAYLGCVAGAARREEYLGAIQAAGFQRIQVMDESSFSAEHVAHDPTVKAIVENSGLSRDQLRDLGRSVVSVKVQATKPHATA